MVHLTRIAGALLLALTAGHAGAQTEAPPAATESAMVEGGTWDEIKSDIVGDGPILDGADLFTLDAPFRAEDAAIVPIHITQAEGTPVITKLTLVVDENPAPVVAEFTFGPAIGPVDLETRIRVNAYSNVRAIAETADGALYMTGRYVRAAGGCSAPASKDAAAALAALGQMRTRWFDGGGGGQSVARREAQVMLRHPNYSGLQRNQVTHLFVPANFVSTLDVRQGDALLFTMEGGISISEDPTFRFRYTDTSGEALEVHAQDTDGRVFDASFPPGS